MLPSLFGLKTTFMCYREKHVGLHGGSWCKTLYPHETTLCGEKSLIITVKNYMGRKHNYLNRPCDNVDQSPSSPRCIGSNCQLAALKEVVLSVWLSHSKDRKCVVKLAEMGVTSVQDNHLKPSIFVIFNYTSLHIQGGFFNWPPP